MLATSVIFLKNYLLGVKIRRFELLVVDYGRAKSVGGSAESWQTALDKILLDIRGILENFYNHLQDITSALQSERIPPECLDKIVIVKSILQCKVGDSGSFERFEWLSGVTGCFSNRDN